MTTIKVGQEWEKAGRYRRLATRIRIVTEPDTSVYPSVYVESLLERRWEADRWGRRRRLLCSALNNAPSGYRLVKEAP